MNILSNDSLTDNMLVYILVGVILGSLIVFSPYVGISFVAAVVIFISFSNSPLKALSIMILLMPFGSTRLLRDNLVDLPGAKPLLILTLFVVCIAAINYSQAARIPYYASIFLAIVVITFTVSILRSLPNLDLITYYWENTMSTREYLLSQYVKPLIYIVPLIVIAKFALKYTDLEFVVNCLVLSLVFFSVSILYLYIFVITGKGSISQVGEYYHIVFGMHRNTLASFFIVGLPFVFARYFVKRHILNILSICLTVAAIGFLYSRAAYVTLLCSIVLYLFISRRARLLPIVLAIGFVLSLFISSTVMQRISTGLESKDLNTILAGRMENMWIPLSDEYIHDYRKLFFGNGRYAMSTSEAAQKGLLKTTATHPHNMYLEQVLEAGLIGLVAFLLLFLVLFKKAYGALNNIHDQKVREYQYAVIVSLICYLISGFTERSFFPTISNGFLWIVIGFLIVITRLSEDSQKYNDAEG